MNPPIDEKYIRSFLKNNKLAVLSTVNKNGLPDAAPIYFIAEDNFDFFFVVPEKTQKNINLKLQNDVVLTITDEKKTETVQVRGKAYNNEEKSLQNILKKLAEKLNSEENFITSLPLLQYKDQEKIIVKVKPYEIRMRRYSEDGLDEKKIEIAE